MSKAILTAVISKESKEGGWTFVTWPESAAYLGTGKAVKVAATIEGHEFAITCLPTGNGSHFLPLNKATLKTIGKSVGDTITIEIERPQ